MMRNSSEQPFSFNFFVAALGYRREIRDGKGVYVKRLGRKRYSIITAESFKRDYKEVCKRLYAKKGDNK